MIPKNEKNTDDYQVFIIDEVSWYPYFSTILGVAAAALVLAAVLTTEIKWLTVLPVVLIALYLGQRNVGKKWQKYKAETKKSDYLPDDKCEYWKCSCGRLNPVGTGTCKCGKMAVSDFTQNDKY